MKSKTISISKFKPRVLEILREVEQFRHEVVVTDRGKPIVKILPYTAPPSKALKMLQGSVVKYTDPTEPVDVSWNAIL